MREIYIYGTDRRFDLIAQRFKSEGKTVFREGVSREPAVYLFGLNADKEQIRLQMEQMKPESTVFLSRSNDALQQLALEKGLEIISLMEETSYVSSNAAATAEGTLAAVIQAVPRTLREIRVLICGFGNCGKALAKLLRACGCQVFIFSRSGSMEAAKKAGFSLCRIAQDPMDCFDVILNTVPAPIFSDAVLARIPSGTHLFQIASGCSGMDPSQLEKQGILFHPLPGLPGKVAPESEADTIHQILSRSCSDFKQERQ